MNINKLVTSKNLSILIVVFVITLSCAYASFNSVLYVTGTVADVRIKSDIRITGVRVNGVTNSGSSLSEDYNKSSIKVGTLLPNSGSTVSYAIDITNTGNQEMKLASITGLPDNLEYTIGDYNIGDKLCQNDKCSLGVTKTILLTIKYKEGGFSSTSTYNLSLNFDFHKFSNSYLIKSEYANNDTVKYLNTSIVRNKIQSVHFKDNDEISSNAILFDGNPYFDVSYDKSDSIKLYAEDIDSNGLYEVYIGQDGGVKLNPNSGYLFSCLTKATYIDSINLNTENVVNMNSMFYYCYSLTELEVGHFNTSNVTDMGEMFAGEASNTMKLKTVDVSNWDVSKVKRMDVIFGISTNGGSNSFEVIDVSKWNTSSATTMYKMFQGCKNLQSLDVSNFDTSNVLNMGRMFQDCYNLASVDTSHFNTSKVSNMELMFGALSPYSYKMNFKTLSVSNFDTSKVTDMENMFAGCNLIESLDVSNFDTSNVMDMLNIFAYLSSLTTLDVRNFDTSKVTDMGYMFGGCENLLSLDVSGFITSNVADFGNMFYLCRKLKTLDVSNFDTIAATDISGMFYFCSSVSVIDVSKFNTSNVTKMNYMFYSDNALKSLNLSNFDTKKVTDMSCMFRSCSSLTELNLSNFVTPELTDTHEMFASCSGLKNLNLSNMLMSKVRYMSWMFDSCSSLEILDLSNASFDIATSYLNIFKCLTNLTTIYVKDLRAQEFINARLTDVGKTGVSVEIKA